MKNNQLPLQSWKNRVEVTTTGAAASVLAVIPGQPLDVIKTRKHAEPTASYRMILDKMRQEGKPLYQSLYAGSGSKIFSMGVKGFYRADLITSLPEWIKNQLPEDFVQNNPLAPAAFSILPITVIDVTVKTPLEAMSRMRMAGEGSWGKVWRHVIDKPYAGVGPTVIKDILGWGLFMGVDDMVKLQANALNIPEEKSYFWRPLVSSITTAVLKTYATNPLDIMINGMQKEHWSVREALNKVKGGGVRGACVGAIPRLITGGIEAFSGSTVRQWAEKKRKNNAEAER